MTTFNHLKPFATAIRSLSIDAIETANSGHPGLPLGCAEIGAYLYGHALKHNPKNPHWLNRDRFVLSAGHGSMLLYACLHLSGYDVSLDDIKNFRQLGAPTAGHPEYHELPGVEATTGPLGQGVGMGVGLALGQAMTADTYGSHDLINNYTYVLCGDGCLMEGISAEASSLAGHLKLGRLIMFYDANEICLDGRIDECFTEDVAKRYEAYGWQVISIDGHNYDEIHQATESAKANIEQPTLIVAKTVIGQGSPNRAGTSEAHGKALGAEESKLTKENLGIPTDQPFYIPKDVTSYIETRLAEQAQSEEAWAEKFAAWRDANPEQLAKGEADMKDIETAVYGLDISGNKASRQSSNAVLQVLHDTFPYLVGGSADLSCSDSTMMKGSGVLTSNDYSQRNIKYGVREFGMAAIANGIALYGAQRPYIGTFFTFSDYMKNAIRLAAIMSLPVIYQFTHDSIFLGEDGPTHQSVEHLASLRAIPNVTVLRPANSEEVKGAWIAAIQSQNPTALVLSRQSLSDEIPTDARQVAKGAYVVFDTNADSYDFTLFSTGSEVGVTYQAAKALAENGHQVRLISVPSFELLDQQSAEYKTQLLDAPSKVRASVEAQTSFGWHKYVGRDGLTISVDTFGVSGKGADLAEKFGFTKDQLVDTLSKQLSHQLQTT